MKVGMLIANTPNGLHDGHKTIIEWGKQFGDITVNAIENVKVRNQYLFYGDGVPKYKVDLTKIDADCAEVGVNIKLQPYIQISEERRLWFLDKARTFANAYRRDLISQRYISMVTASLMTHMIYTESKNGTVSDKNIMIAGPDVMSFFYNSISDIVNWSRREIYPAIIKGDYGLKTSSSFSSTSHDISGLRKIVNQIRDRYIPGQNRSLVNEINNSYPNELWKVHEILVYEGGFVKGRVEVTAFGFMGDQQIDIVEEIDYEQ